MANIFEQLNLPTNLPLDQKTVVADRTSTSPVPAGVPMGQRYTGLVVWDTNTTGENTPGLYVWDGSQWNAVSHSGTPADTGIHVVGEISVLNGTSNLAGDITWSELQSQATGNVARITIAYTTIDPAVTAGSIVLASSASAGFTFPFRVFSVDPTVTGGTRYMFTQGPTNFYNTTINGNYIGSTGAFNSAMNGINDWTFTHATDNEFHSLQADPGINLTVTDDVATIGVDPSYNNTSTTRLVDEQFRYVHDEIVYISPYLVNSSGTIAATGNTTITLDGSGDAGFGANDQIRIIGTDQDGDTGTVDVDVVSLNTDTNVLVVNNPHNYSAGATSIDFSPTDQIRVIEAENTNLAISRVDTNHFGRDANGRLTLRRSFRGEFDTGGSIESFRERFPFGVIVNGDIVTAFGQPWVWTGQDTGDVSRQQLTHLPVTNPNWASLNNPIIVLTDMNQTVGPGQIAVIDSNTAYINMSGNEVIGVNTGTTFGSDIWTSIGGGGRTVITGGSTTYNQGAFRISPSNTDTQLQVNNTYILSSVQVEERFTIPGDATSPFTATLGRLGTPTQSGQELVNENPTGINPSPITFGNEVAVEDGTRGIVSVNVPFTRVNANDVFFDVVYVPRYRVIMPQSPSAGDTITLKKIGDSHPFIYGDSTQTDATAQVLINGAMTTLQLEDNEEVHLTYLNETRGWWLSRNEIVRFVDGTSAHPLNIGLSSPIEGDLIWVEGTVGGITPGLARFDGTNWISTSAPNDDVRNRILLTGGFLLARDASQDLNTRQAYRGSLIGEANTTTYWFDENATETINGLATEGVWYDANAAGNALIGFPAT